MNLGKLLACCSSWGVEESDVVTEQQECIKIISNKDLLYSTGNSIQCSVTAFMQEKSWKKMSEFMYMCH